MDTTANATGTGSATGLRAYLRALRDQTRDLLVVEREVEAGQETCSIVKALEPLGAPAVLFTAVRGSRWPVVMGLFGTRHRIAAMIGTDEGTALDRVLALQDGPLADVEEVDDAPAQQWRRTGDEVSLADLPIAVHSRDDAAPYITSGVIVARDPRTGLINTGMYRMMVLDERHVTVNAAPDHDLGRILAKAHQDGTTVPIAIVIGHHPAYLVASQVKNPATVDSHRIAATLMGGPLRVAPALTVDLPIPADAEIIIEGVIDPDAMSEEGPFGEFSYYYGATNAPVCTVQAVTARTDAVFLDLHPTHREHLGLWLFPGREARFLQRVRESCPGVQRVRIPFHSGGLTAFISISKEHEGDGKQAILAGLAADHFLKQIVVVDDDIDIFDDRRVLWAVAVRSQADADLVTLEGARGIKMDPSATAFTDRGRPDYVSAKAGVDATRRLHPRFPVAADLPHPGLEDLDALAAFEGRDRRELDGRWRHLLDFRE
jgi:2,5-furandicarboxylate decarboxylase 1